jgi:hypothetical protein
VLLITEDGGKVIEVYSPFTAEVESGLLFNSISIRLKIAALATDTIRHFVIHAVRSGMVLPFLQATDRCRMNHTESTWFWNNSVRC